MEHENRLPKGFIEKYRIGKGNELVFIALRAGFLRIEYLVDDDQSLINKVAFIATKSEHSSIIGKWLELGLGSYTYMDEQGLSGNQWSEGDVSWDNVYDSGPTTKIEKISLSKWIDRCLKEMINPPGKNLADICKHYDPTKDIPLLQSKDPEPGNRFWTKCSPATGKELDQILNLLKRAVETEDNDTIFICSNPLKRASAEIPRLLNVITELLEEEKITDSYERSILHDVLEAHASKANAAISKRWMVLCKKAIVEKGFEKFFAENNGGLLSALSTVPKPGVKVLLFFKEIINQVNGTHPEVQQDIERLIFFKKLKKVVIN